MEYHQEIEILDNAYSAKISAIPFPHPNSVVSSFLFPVSFPSFLFIYPSWLCTWVYTHTNPIFLYSRPAVGFELLLHHLNTPQGTTTRHRPWKQHRCHTRRVGQSAGIAIEPSTRFSNIFILSSNLLHPSSASQLAAYPAQTTQLLVMAHRGAFLGPAHHLLPGLLSPEHLCDFLIDASSPLTVPALREGRYSASATRTLGRLREQQEEAKWLKAETKPKEELLFQTQAHPLRLHITLVYQYCYIIECFRTIQTPPLRLRATPFTISQPPSLPSQRAPSPSDFHVPIPTSHWFYTNRHSFGSSAQLHTRSHRRVLAEQHQSALRYGPHFSRLLRRP